MKGQLVCLCLLAFGVLTAYAADKNFDYEETGKRNFRVPNNLENFNLK